MQYANHRVLHSSVQTQVESWRTALGVAEACAALLPNPPRGKIQRYLLRQARALVRP